MSERAGGHKERRTSERIDIGGKLPSQLALELDTSVVQISAVGMMVELPMPLTVGSKHGFTIALEKRELALNGMVRNCHRVSSAGAAPPNYHVGIEFCDLSESEAQFLDAFIEEKLKR